MHNTPRIIAALAATATLAFGCAEGQKETRTGGTTTAGGAAVEQQTPEAGIPPEKIEEVQATFRRKSMQVQSCYSDEMQRTSNKKVEGDVMIGMTLKTSGKASDVKVLKTTLNSPNIETCVVDQVKSWSFTELPQQGYFNWTFHFKPAY